MPRIHEVGKIPVIRICRVSLNYLRRERMATRGELDDIYKWLVARQILRTQPSRAQEILVVAVLVVLAADENGKSERLARLGLRTPVVSVEIVVKRLIWTLAEAPRVRLYSDLLAMRVRPFGHALQPLRLAVTFARGVERVEKIKNRLEPNGAMYALVDAEAYLH